MSSPPDDDELARLLPDVSAERLGLVQARLAQLRSDLELIRGPVLGFTEPLILPSHADQWLEAGAGDD